MSDEISTLLGAKGLDEGLQTQSPRPSNTDPDTSSKVSDEVLDLFREDFDEDSCKGVCKNLGV